MEFLSGFRAPVVGALPSAATFVGQIFEQGGALWFSNGSAWIRLDNVPGGAGTVTSVGLTVPAGMAVSGSPVTTSGTLAITIDNAGTFRSTIGAGTGNGTVTSVGLSAPAQFSVSGSPVSSSGTLTFAWNNQTANTVLAAPNGVSGAPTFRVLAAADIPALDASKINSGTFTRDRIGSGASAGRYLVCDLTGHSWVELSVNLGSGVVTGTLPVARGGTGVTTSTGTTNVVLSNGPTLSTVTLTGTTTASFIQVGPTSPHNLLLEASSSEANVIARSNVTMRVGQQFGGTGDVILYNGSNDRLWVKSSGRVGIANSNPSEVLHVTGNILASGSITPNSDARMKRDVAPLRLELADILRVDAVSFTRIADESHGLGVTAQNLESVLPRAVITHDDGMKSVAYGEAATVMVLNLARELSLALKRIEELEHANQRR